MLKAKPQMESQASEVKASVFAFYRELPFNYRQDASAHAEAIRRADALRAYPPLLELLISAPRLVDMGCGAGWLPNSAAYHHRCPALGLDFNPVAIERAREVARILSVNATFEVSDLFSFRPERRFDLVTSIGVLHHTENCLGGLRHIAQHILAPLGHLFVGLYHTHGRRPFLKHFEEMKKKGADEDKMFSKFRAMRLDKGASGDDEVFLRSWFRDQVLHPHETCHTLSELLPLFDELDLELISTSVNRFAPLPKRAELLAMEADLEEAGHRALKENRYFPGFFVFLVKSRKVRGGA